MATDSWARLSALMAKHELSVEFAHLDQLADAEAVVLREIGGAWKSAANARTSARAFIADDVLERLKCNKPLKPQEVLRHRRMHYTWAAASLIRAAQGKRQED